jgi:tetratricopeptide (TPR) repeat protein
MNDIEDINEYDKEILYYCYILLSKYYIKCSEHKDVIVDAIKQAIILYPNRAEAYSTIGNYFYKIGNYNLCYYNLEKALLQPKNKDFFMCYQNYYSIIKNHNIIIASIILDKNNSAFEYLKELKNNNTNIYKYYISLIKHNNLL